MFLSLFLKECKMTAKSLVYWACMACLAFFFFTQLGADSWSLARPQPGQQDYGYTYSQDADLIMEKNLQSLALDHYSNRYTAYPLGFYKSVTLSQEKQEQMGELLLELSGMSVSQIEGAIDAYIDEADQTAQEEWETDPMTGLTADLEVHPREGLTLEEFLDAMDEADRLIGGHSTYTRSAVEKGVLVHQTYEGALKEYQDIVEKDRYTGAFARLFCDYMGILLAILPVFPAVSRCLKDRRAKASLVIASKKASSSVLLAARYLAALFMLMIPVAVLAAFAGNQCMAAAGAAGIHADGLAFFKYVGGWLFPSAAFALALGFFISTLTGGMWAVLAGGLFWFFSLFQSFGNLNGDFGLKLIPRFNDFGYTELFYSQLGDLTANRAFYLALTALLLVLTVLAHRWNRRGGELRLGKLRKSRRRAA